MTSYNAVYLRVSRKDLDEEKQYAEIKGKFNVSGMEVFREKISAYDEEKQEQRTEFQRLKRLILEGEIKRVYVFSVERLERNIVRLFEFYFFCEAHGCKIYSVKQDIPNKREQETPQETFLRYVHVLLFGYKGQEESFTTSYRTKSAVIESNGNTYSYKGNKWGKRFKNLEGEKVQIGEETLEAIQKTIRAEIATHEKKGHKGYYAKVIDKIGKSYNIKISKAYISILKNG